MKNLISTTDFNIQQFELLTSGEITETVYIDRVIRYSKTLKQPIQKNMFVPCQDDGDIFETPTSCNKSCSPSDWCIDGKCDKEGCYEESGKYYEACKTVLFEGWGYFTNSLSAIETGFREEVTNDELTIYFRKDGLVVFNYKNYARMPIETIEDLLKIGFEFVLSDNFKKEIRL